MRAGRRSIDRSQPFARCERDLIEPVDAAAAAAARERIDQLTKPAGSLGRIETLAIQLCAIAGKVIGRAYEKKAILIGAADHGVAAEGVSAYPSEVTPQMIGAFLAGHAAISAFARTARADVFVADFGVARELPPHPKLIDVHVGRGTANFARGAAMDVETMHRALAAGERALDIVLAGAAFDVIALGDMGIGNTTSAAAIVALCSGQQARAVTGRGTGIDDVRHARKVDIVAAAIEPLRDEPWETMAAAVGGFEIVGLAGAIVRAASLRLPVVLDGFIVAAAALLAQRIEPHVVDYCIAAHRSREPGHRVALATLGLEPLLDLDLRLGEGSGAALALPIVEAATRMIAEMQTFAEAGVATSDTTRTP